MPVYRHVEQEGDRLSQSARETASRGPSSLSASRRGHQEDRARLFTTSQGKRLRNNHGII